MSTTVVEFENQDVIVVEMSGRGPMGPRGRQGEPGPAGPSEWGVIQGNISDQTDLQNALDAKANVGDSYTKAEDDALLAQKADADSVYTKTETDSLLADKADADDVYTKDDVDDALDLKADSADVYTKDETDEMLLAKAPVILSSASGSIASFSDGSPAPVTALTVAIEPVQDLHGYDNPWPAGGGENLLPMTVTQFKSANTNGTWSNNDYTINGITFALNVDNNNNITGIKVNGTATNSAYLLFMTQDNLLVVESGSYASFISSSNVNVTLQMRKDNTGGQDIMGGTTTHKEATISEQTSVIVRLAVSSGATISNVTVYPMFAKQDIALTIADFAPYSNICPISGHTTAVVTRTGKNLFKGKDLSSAVSGVDCSCSVDGTITANGTNSASSEKYFNIYSNSNGNRLPLKAGTYTISTKSAIPTGLTISIGFRDSSGNSIGISSVVLSSSKSSGTVTINQDFESYIFLSISANATISYNGGLQIERSSSASPYTLYQGQTVTIDLDGTRHGGVLNLLTGEMVVDRAYVLLTGGESWSYYRNIDRTNFTSFKAKIFSSTVKEAWSGASVSNAICSIASVNANNVYSHLGTGIAIDQSQWFYLCISSGIADTTEKLSTYLANNSVQVVAKLVTPLTVQLTPSQMQTLLGQNNIWADTGNTSVEYRADTKLYIDGKFSQLQALILEN